MRKASGGCCAKGAYICHECEPLYEIKKRYQNSLWKLACGGFLVILGLVVLIVFLMMGENPPVVIVVEPIVSQSVEPTPVVITDPTPIIVPTPTPTGKKPVNMLSLQPT